MHCVTMAKNKTPFLPGRTDYQCTGSHRKENQGARDRHQESAADRGGRQVQDDAVYRLFLHDDAESTQGNHKSGAEQEYQSEQMKHFKDRDGPL